MNKVVVIGSILLLTQIAHAQRYTALNCPGETVAVNTNFYIAASAGATGFGKVWVGAIDGSSLTMGVEGAYFFMEKLGAGLVYNTSRCDVDIKNEGAIGKDIVSFIGPSVYGRYGLIRSFIFTGCAGVGMLNWTFSRYIGSTYDYGVYTSSIGGYVALGGCYLITQNLGAGVKIQTTLGSLKNQHYERNPTALGCTFYTSFYF